jgi:hypothetical protein
MFARPIWLSKKKHKLKNLSRPNGPKDCARDYSPQSAQLVKKLKQVRKKKTCALHLKCVLSLAKASIALGDTACRPEIVDAEEAMALFVMLCHLCTFGQDNSNFI